MVIFFFYCVSGIANFILWFNRNPVKHLKGRYRVERNSAIALQRQRVEEGKGSFKLVARSSIYVSNRCDISFCKRGAEPHFLITHNGVRFEYGMKHSRLPSLSIRGDDLGKEIGNRGRRSLS